METPEPEREGAGVSFGPLDGLRALTNLQRQGIAAATEVAERFTTMFDGFGRPAPGPRPPDSVESLTDESHPGPDDVTDQDAMSELRSNVARGFDLYSRMFQTTFESWADLVEDRMRDRGITLGAGDKDDAVAVGSPGAIAKGEVWVHNHSEEQVGPLQLIITPGFSANGTSISPAAFELSPSSLSIPASTSRRVEVTVDLSDQETDKVLHALVLVNELADEALPLRIIVRGAPEASDDPAP